MRVIHLPLVIRGLIFDIDLTLYGSSEYYDEQKRLLVNELASATGRPFDEALIEIDAYRDTYARENGGRKPSLGNIFLNYGVSIETNCIWRSRLFEPEHYLSYDGMLVDCIESLCSRYSLAVVTNNTTPIAERTLEVLGVRKYFPIIVALDRSLALKPSIVPFEIASSEMSLRLTELVSIGDRMEVDIELPVANGMGGILIERIEDVYSLPKMLLD
jgi:FMN phosphatase YigB (HAD superfamily)